MDNSLESKVNKLEVELGAMREKISFFNVIYGKFDDTLDKIQELMETRRNEMNDDLRDVYQKIEDTEKKIMSEFHQLRQEMKAQHEIENRKIEDLNRWRWFVIGASAIVGFIISNAIKLFK